MEGYLGETKLDISKTKYAKYTPQDWVMLWLAMYIGIDGAHHKDWLLDQIARISKGTKVILVIDKWENGTEEERFELEEPAKKYEEWVTEMKNGEDGPDTYDYDTGIAP